MNLNKSSSYTLLHILNGCDTAAKVAEQMPSIDIRSIQRSLTRLVELGVIEKHGLRNSPSYSINYPALLQLPIADKLIEDNDRPATVFHHDLIAWLIKTPVSALTKAINQQTKVTLRPMTMTQKELEFLTVELSWKSSALEGNTYTLLDTQLLLTEGLKAKNRTEFETQMILNHKNALSFILSNPELFKENIRFSTLEELHKLISQNLGIDTGVRRRLVKISASNYTPLGSPHQLRESANDILAAINRVPDPYEKSLLAFSLVPYLQVFEDGNKRTGRMLANAILISIVGRGFSLRSVDARQLAIAYLSFYEFNSLAALSMVLSSELA